MANFLHRTTKQYQASVSPNSLPEPIGNYIENPDLSAVAGEPNYYWIVTGDIVSLMDQAEQGIVDVARETQGNDSLMNEFDAKSFVRALARATLSAVNTLRDAHGQPAVTNAQWKNLIRSFL